MSIFPFIDSDISEDEKADSELLVFKEYAYDFLSNSLKLDEEGKTYLVQGNEALRIWIYKALLTQRFRYTAYSTDFGSEHENLIGQPVDGDIVILELERYIIEALMVNPYIEELNEFIFERKANSLSISFTCSTVYGEEKITYSMEGVGS